ncbi:MAG TPA: hypothetical protein PK020_16665 [Ilumatobacteraceae bacterium]|nr:hypothetical protein [Ilumatobacteraceae bacterium]HRB03893.1 hypothetical protein [Ilumatobacteraceae bacterium]
MTDWLPTNLPERVETDGLTFIPLTPALVEADYAAVMRDIPLLRAWSGQDWPTATFPIEWNLEDLIRHDREQTDRIALTYSVLIDGVVQGCIYAQPLAASLAGRGVSTEQVPTGTGDVVVRGWLHDRPALDLIAASMSWLGDSPFEFPRLWWQTNSQCPEQLAACDALGMRRVMSVQGEDRTWEMRR